VIPTVGHDIHVDLVVTPTRTIECPRRRGHRLPTLRWAELTDEKIAAIPLLAALRNA
jgi:5-formyltetrahydrofolate cyclo-ligase